MVSAIGRILADDLIFDERFERFFAKTKLLDEDSLAVLSQEGRRGNLRASIIVDAHRTCHRFYWPTAWVVVDEDRSSGAYLRVLEGLRDI